MKTIDIITLGCPKNEVDSEKILAGLDKTKYKIKPIKSGNVNTLIINTCGFINSAKIENINEIVLFAELRRTKRIKELIVIGCLTQRYGKELKKQIPFIDKVFGANEITNVINYLNKTDDAEIGTDRVLLKSQHSAYLKISEGCSRRCAFCAIPFIRGNHVSIEMDVLLEEANKLAQRGVKELIVVAQDTTFYGIDIYGERKLAELLDKLSEIKEFEWIRLMYAFPTDFPDDVLEVIARKPNICKYLDIPLQHISTKVLKAMNRGIDEEGTTELIKKIREKVPGIAIRTTFLVGFPGENNEDFHRLHKFITDTKFARLGCFTYSKEEDTSSFALKETVKDKVKTERVDKIMLSQMEISTENNRNLIGQTMKIIIDAEIDEEYNEYPGYKYIGRTEYDAPEIDNAVLVKTDKTIEIGTFVNVKILDAEEYDLFAELV